MKLVFIFALSVAAAFAQAVAYNNAVYTTSGQVPAGALTPVLAVPGSTIAVCQDSACLTRATTYTSPGAGTSCPTLAQLIPATGSGTCTSLADGQGNFFFYALPGQYWYRITLPAAAGGGSYIYPISIGASAGCPLGAVCDANYASLAAAFTAAGTGTLYITRAWNAQTTASYTAPVVFLGNGKIQPASGQTVTITGQFNCLQQQCLDYSAGGTFDLTAAQFPVAYPEWGGCFPASSTAACGLVITGGDLISKILTSIGPNRAINLGVGNGCYALGSTTIELGPSQGIIGPSPFSKACLSYTGSADVVSNLGTSAYFTVKNFSILTTTAANGIHFNGAVGLNAVNVTISGVEFCPLNTSVYSNAEVLLEDTFLVNVTNNNIDAPSPYGVKLSSTFNNTDRIEGNNIKGTSLAGIYCNNSCTNMRFRDNVIEGNGAKAIFVDTGNPVGVLEISGNHTEDNQIGGPDWDIYVRASTAAFNGAWGSVRVVSNSLQAGASALGSIYIAYQQSVTIEDNACLVFNSEIKLGPAVVNPYVRSNNYCSLVSDSGTAISDSDSVLSYGNLFESSVALDNSVVSGFWGTNTSVDQSGSPLFDDGTPAWNLNISTTAVVSGSITTTPTGRLFSCGVWAKTNTGTATGFTSLYDAFGTYTGSLGTTFFTLDSTRWRWIGASSTTDATDTSAFFGCGWSFTVVSGATKIILAKPDLCADTMNCGYIPTTTATILKTSSPIGHTVFAQLPSATASQPPIICDDCIVASTCEGGGSGALVVPIGATNVCK